MKNERSERLIFFREKQLKITQDEMAKRLNTNRAAYGKMENGGGISEQYLYPLLSLGLSLNWLFSGKGDMELQSEQKSVQIGALNTGIAGTISHTYNNVSDCEKELAVMVERVAGLQRELEAKNEIISLLKNK